MLKIVYACQDVLVCTTCSNHSQLVFHKQTVDFTHHVCDISVFELIDSQSLQYVLEMVNIIFVQDVTLVGTSMGASTIWSYIELFGEVGIARAVFVDQAPLQVQH